MGHGSFVIPSVNNQIDELFRMVDSMVEADLIVDDDGSLSIAIRRSLEDEGLERDAEVHLDLPVEMYSDQKRLCTTCSICLSDFEPEDSVSAPLCNHTFHVNCLSEWVKYKPDCPVCRTSIDEPPEPLDEDIVITHTSLTREEAAAELAHRSVEDVVMRITNNTVFTD